MLFGDKRLYERARKAKLGKTNLSGPLEELRIWVSSRYSINVLDVVYDLIDVRPNESRPRLNLIVETTPDHDKLYKSRWTLKPNYRKSILNRFSRIVSSSSRSSKFNTENVLLITDDFSREAMGQAAERFRSNDVQAILAKFPDVQLWKISGFSARTVVFYLRNDDVARNRKNGVSEAIQQECYDRVKSYDEFDYFTPDNFELEFDSKQNVDENYEGSMFYYWR